jgi:hypothetical protein
MPLPSEPVSRSRQSGLDSRCYDAR